MTNADHQKNRSQLSLSLPGTRVVLAGTGNHAAGSTLPNLPVVGRTVHDLKTAFVERCGVVRQNLRECVDPTPDLLHGTLIGAAEEATDVLLFYYVGHGIVSAGNELYLATVDTDHHLRALATRALPYSAVRDALTDCQARSIVVILDCCFSGRAQGTFGTAVADALGLASLGGTYLLASAAPEERALAPDGDRNTAFTGQLITFLREGDPTAPRWLTVEEAWRHLSHTLPRRGFPLPHRQLSGHSGDLVLAVNPAAPAVVVPPRPAGEPPRPDQPCPYRGLEAFTAMDARYFFGRDELTAELVQHLAAHRRDMSVVAVVGPSGSGKSSLLQAGLLTAVARGQLPVSGSCLLPAPGEHPLDALVARLGDRAGILRRPPVSRPGGQLLLVVDQFEELFTACHDEDERQAFIRAVCAAGTPAARGGQAPALVILSIRADFYSHCLRYPELVRVFEHGQILVTPMSPTQLREAVEKPAEVAGLRMEDGLMDLLLHDLRSEQDSPLGSAGTLPLLSYALLGTWQRRVGPTLTMAGYRATGGIWHAVTQQADRVYAGLDAAGQRAARRMLLRMVHIAVDTEDARRRARLDTLVKEGPADEADALISARDAFANARLITLDESTAQFTHEALLRAWPRLRGWITEDRAGLLIHQQLSDAAGVWLRDGRDRGALYRGTRLAAARQWLADQDHQTNLGALEHEFFAASIRSGRLRRLRTVAIVLVLVLAAVTGVVAVRQSRVAAEQSRIAVDRDRVLASRQLAAQADVARNSDPAAALHLSLAAYRTAPTTEARAAVYSSSVTPYPTLLRGHSGRVVSVAYSPDGRVVASSDNRGTVRLWDVSDLRHAVELAALSVPGSVFVALSPDGKILAAHGERTLMLWDVTDPRHPAPKADVATFTGLAYSVAFSPDGNVLATGSDEGIVRLWDVHDRSRPTIYRSLSADDQGATSVAFHPNGTALAIASRGGKVRIWSLAPDPPTVIATMPVRFAWSVAFRPDGAVLAAGGTDAELNMWTVTDLRNPVPVKDFQLLERSDISSVAFSQDGRTLATAGSNGSVSRIDVSGDLSQGSLALSALRTNVGVIAVVFSPDNQRLVTGSVDGIVRVWTRPSPPPIPHRILSERYTAGLGVAFGGGGTTLTTMDLDLLHPTGIRLWDTTDPRRPAMTAELPPRWETGSFLADGHTFITRAKDWSIYGIWDASDPRHPELAATIPRVGPPDHGLEVDVKGHVFALRDKQDDTIHIWDITDPHRPVAVSTVSGKDITDFGLANDQLVTFDRQGAIRLYDVADPRHPGKAVLLPDSRRTYEVTLDKGLTITRTADHQVMVWDMAKPDHPARKNDIAIPADHLATFDDGRMIAIGSNQAQTIAIVNITDHDHPYVAARLPVGNDIGRMQVSADGRTVVASLGILSEKVRVWDISSLDSISEYTIPVSASDLELSPDNHTLALFGRDANREEGVRLWELDPDRQYHDLCATMGDGMTPAEWAQLVPNRAYQKPCS